MQEDEKLHYYQCRKEHLVTVTHSTCHGSKTGDGDWQFVDCVSGFRSDSHTLLAAGNKNAQIYLRLYGRSFYLGLFMRTLLREIILQTNYAVIMEMRESCSEAQTWHDNAPAVCVCVCVSVDPCVRSFRARVR